MSRRITISRHAILAVACPLCHAMPGKVCRRMPRAGKNRAVRLLLDDRVNLQKNRSHDLRVAAVARSLMEAAGKPCPNCQSTQHVRCCERCGMTAA